PRSRGCRGDRDAPRDLGGGAGGVRRWRSRYLPHGRRDSRLLRLPARPLQAPQGRRFPGHPTADGLPQGGQGRAARALPRGSLLMPRYASIVGTGCYIPEREISNDFLRERFPEPAGFVDKMEASTGIRRRYWAPEGWATSDLALPAARQ